jgi:glycosyltransferase involved in cell wall biosynthesis
VHLEAWRRYRDSSGFDVVVDQINTIPFYAHCYALAPSIALIYQLAQEVWRYELPAPLGVLGAAAEPVYLRPYRDAHVMSISPSTISSLRSLGFRGPISLVPIAVDEPADPTVPQKAEPRDVVMLCRITPSKRPEHAIEAAAALRARGWAGRFILVGSGDAKYVERIRAQGTSLLGDRFVMTGRVDDVQRSAFLRDASCIWMTSVREGWGLAVTEAARHGTPAVVYRVPGLVDSVDDGTTGYVVEPNPDALADATARLFGENYSAFTERALAASRAYDWEITTDRFERALRDRIAASQLRTPGS